MSQIHGSGGGELHTELSRDLTLTSALAIGVGTMIAAGIFTLSGLAVRNVGTSAIIAFLLAAAVATLTALTYCEFSSIYPESGEGYLYARKTFPPPALGEMCVGSELARSAPKDGGKVVRAPGPFTDLPVPAFHRPAFSPARYAAAKNGAATGKENLVNVEFSSIRLKPDQPTR